MVSPSRVSSSLPAVKAASFPRHLMWQACKSLLLTGEAESPSGLGGSGDQAAEPAKVVSFGSGPTISGDSATPDHSHRLSVIVPCYNEAATVVEILRRTRAALPHAQIIVVDDGSTNGSAALVESVCVELNLTLHRLATNQGKGTAFRAGLNHAGREYVIPQDADLEYERRDISRSLGHAVRGELGAVYGSRYDAKCRNLRRPLQDLAVRILAILLLRRHDLNMSDPATCYKLLRRQVLETTILRSDGFELCQELNICAVGFARFEELPIRYRPRTVSEGKKIRLQDFFRCCLVILKGY